MNNRPILPEGVTPEFDGPVAICAYSGCQHYDTYEDACKLVDATMMEEPCLPYHEWLAADHAWLEARVKALAGVAGVLYAAANVAKVNGDWSHYDEAAEEWRELTGEEGGQR